MRMLVPKNQLFNDESIAVQIGDGSEFKGYFVIFCGNLDILFSRTT